MGNSFVTSFILVVIIRIVYQNFIAKSFAFNMNCLTI